MLRLLLSALYPPFGSNIAEAIFGSKSISVYEYVSYLRCFKWLARWYVVKCDSKFKQVKGFGYARRLVVNIGVNRIELYRTIELYFPLTRLLDFVVWSTATHKDKKTTMYEFLVNTCSI